jgi:ankyrin repeat protein
LTVAAAYRDTAASLERLIEAGADVDVPDGVHPRRSPLVLAAMSGDIRNVTLLLARDATPDEEALAEAVTFGHAEIARMLIRAGADAKITERSGINLLHWAVIANRPSVIPVLVEAGVPLNATDDAGFTPLMYAATIDMGETAVAQALVNAGADRGIRNPAKRTPLAQARHYRHRQLEELLKQLD